MRKSSFEIVCKHGEMSFFRFKPTLQTLALYIKLLKIRNENTHCNESTHSNTLSKSYCCKKNIPVKISLYLPFGIPFFNVIIDGYSKSYGCSPNYSDRVIEFTSTQLK